MQLKYKTGSYYCIVRLLAAKKGVSAIESKISELDRQISENEKGAKIKARNRKQKQEPKKNVQAIKENDIKFRDHWWQFWRWSIRHVHFYTPPKTPNTNTTKNNAVDFQANKSSEKRMLEEQIDRLYLQKTDELEKIGQKYYQIEPIAKALLKSLNSLDDTSLRYLGFHACHLYEKHNIKANLESAPIISVLSRRGLVKIPKVDYQNYPENCYVGVCAQLKKEYKNSPGVDKQALKDVFSFLMENQEYFSVLYDNWKKSVPNESAKKP